MSRYWVARSDISVEDTWNTFPTFQRFLILLMENMIQPVCCVRVFAVSCRKIADPSLLPHSNICFGLSAAGILMTKNNKVWGTGGVSEWSLRQTEYNSSYSTLWQILVQGSFFTQILCSVKSYDVDMLGFGVFLNVFCQMYVRLCF